MAAADDNIGLIGLAVMGANLVLNMADHGVNVVVYNRTTSKVTEFLEGEAKGKTITGAYSVQELISKLKKPRKVMILVQAGKGTDAVIDELAALLDQGDIIIDGGNAYYPDTIRRFKALQEKNILFVGSGVSGGEEGARTGPSLMPGGSEAAWKSIAHIFQKIAAQVEGQPCCNWVGSEGAGHYVKMVHNGIEYGDMQIIAEAFDFLYRGLNLPIPEIASIFEEWNRGPLDSYLIQITTEILKFNDDDGVPAILKILDSAGQKGTGKWTAEAALAAGMPVTLIGEAVFARCLSALKDERVEASKLLKTARNEAAGYEVPEREEWPPASIKQRFANDADGLKTWSEQFKKDTIRSLGDALYASKIISYTQGFQLLREAEKEFKWGLNYGEIAAMWRGGCIIKSVFLKDITNAYRKNPELKSLLFDDFFRDAVIKATKGWRKTICTGVTKAIPMPCLSAALAFYDGYNSEILPANILQGLRDRFGAHGFLVQRGMANDKFQEGVNIHVDWTKKGGRYVAGAYNS